LRRELSEKDQASVDMYAQRYVEYKETYRSETGMQGSREAGK
jgi:hypothetical protein